MNTLNTQYLESITKPEDLRRLSLSQLDILADEIRQTLINRIAITGGHIGSNLGVVEATIALHRVFNAPNDRIVFDVSHQCYTHKILTGRAKAYIDPQQFNTVSGFTNPQESEFDLFSLGHTASSISLAYGLAVARDIVGGDERIIAFIGDGAMSGGPSFEGLDNAGTLNSNFIVIINDNERSIAENHGSLYAHLAYLRAHHGNVKDNYFTNLGFAYHYVERGNNIHDLIAAFEIARDRNIPQVIHIHTTKGLGLQWAMDNPESGHWEDCADAVPEGAILPKAPDDARKYYGKRAMQIIQEAISEQKKYSNNVHDEHGKAYVKLDPIVVISPATPGSNGITPAMRHALGEHYVDCGICEEHAIAMAAGIAKAGGKPIVATSATFFQRACDQFNELLGINSLPAVILMFQNGLECVDATHLGTFDLAFFSHIPNVKCYAPTCTEEYEQIVRMALQEENNPIIIRVPSEIISHDDLVQEMQTERVQTEEMVNLGNREVASYDGENENSGVLREVREAVHNIDSLDADHAHSGHNAHDDNLKAQVAIVGLGIMYRRGLQVQAELQRHGVKAIVHNPLTYHCIDEQLLQSYIDSDMLIVTLENSMLAGGFGERVARYVAQHHGQMLIRGGGDEFQDRIALSEQYERYGLTVAQLVADIMQNIA